MKKIIHALSILLTDSLNFSIIRHFANGQNCPRGGELFITSSKVHSIHTTGQQKNSNSSTVFQFTNLLLSCGVWMSIFRTTTKYRDLSSQLSSSYLENVSQLSNFYIDKVRILIRLGGFAPGPTPMNQHSLQSCRSTAQRYALLNQIFMLHFVK